MFHYLYLVWHRVASHEDPRHHLGHLCPHAVRHIRHQGTWVRLVQFHTLNGVFDYCITLLHKEIAAFFGVRSGHLVHWLLVFGNVQFLRKPTPSPSYNICSPLIDFPLNLGSFIAALKSLGKELSCGTNARAHAVWPGVEWTVWLPAFGSRRGLCGLRRGRTRRKWGGGPTRG